MLKTWPEEVEQARRVVEPIVNELDVETLVEFDDGAGFEFDAALLRLSRRKKEATVFITFEARVNAQTDPSDLRAALNEILAKMETGQTKDVVFVVTTTGVITKPRRTPTERVLDEAASLEGDVETQRFRRALG